MLTPTLLSYYTVTIFDSHQVIPIFNAYCSRHHLVIQHGTSKADSGIRDIIGIPEWLALSWPRCKG